MKKSRILRLLALAAIMIGTVCAQVSIVPSASACPICIPGACPPGAFYQTPTYIGVGLGRGQDF